MRQQVEAGRKKGLATASVERLFRQAPGVEQEERADSEPLLVGDLVRHRSLGWVGPLQEVRGTRAEVTVHGKRFSCELEDLTSAADVDPGATEAEAPVRSQGQTGDQVEVAEELNLIGLRVEPALEELDVYLDRALLSPLREVRVVHGFGTGRLRQAVRDRLRTHPAVSGSRPGRGNEGGNGATVVTLRKS
jgi:DNA mismatch repair protein MutS2